MEKQEAMFKGVGFERTLNASAFVALIRSVSKNHGLCHPKHLQDDPLKFITVSVIPIERSSTDERVILCSLEQETGYISAVFALPVNNQNALECFRAGAHVGELKMIFKRYTEAANDEFRKIVRDYLTEGSETLLKVFSFKKEECQSS